MDDLIKRSDAIEAIEVVDWYHQNRNKDMVSGANSDEHQAWYKADDIYKALEAVPSVDRPQGEWIESFKRVEIKQGAYLGTKFIHDGWSCSECSEVVEKRYPNCPYCLARMKGADDEVR